MAKTYFISGHQDLTEEEFVKHYEPVLWKKVNEPDVSFVVSDCEGADHMAQKYLKSMGMKDNVTIFHMYDEPRRNAGFKLAGGYTSVDSVNASMTEASDSDIAWVRPGREKSDTARNIQRRAERNRR